MGLQLTPPTTATVASMPDDHTILVMSDAASLSPEQILWRAALARVWEDAFGGFESGNFYHAADQELWCASARRWLTADYGDDALDRFEVCSAAGCDPDFIRDRARKKLAELRPLESTKPVAIETPTQRVRREKLAGRMLKREQRAKGIISARGKAAATPAATTKRAKPKAKPQRWSSAQFLAWLSANESFLDPAELDEGLAFAAELERQERITAQRSATFRASMASRRKGVGTASAGSIASAVGEATGSGWTAALAQRRRERRATMSDSERQRVRDLDAAKHRRAKMRKAA